MDNIYLGKQPIIDDSAKLYAYEILFRDKFSKSNTGNDRFASSVVINNILSKFGTRTLLGSRKAFIKIDKKFLMNDIIFTIPKEFFIFSIFQSTELDERVIERIQQLHKKGYELAINDVILTAEKLSKYTPILKELSFIKINFLEDMCDDLEKLVEIIHSHNIKVIATKIETNYQYDKAKKCNCDMFQGYFFAEPVILENKKDEPRHLDIFRLYNLLIQDTNIDELASEFEQNPEVTLQLLQFINSGAFHFRKKISSIQHILTLVGRIPLSQWLMLMIYSKSVSSSKGHSPLMLMVRSRTILMQNILKEIDPRVGSNTLGEAYFVGLLSLVDVALSTELKEIVEHINISKEVKDALLRKKGILGEIFVLVQAIENFDTAQIEVFEKKYTLSSDVLSQIILESIENVESFENPKSDEEA